MTRAEATAAVFVLGRAGMTRETKVVLWRQNDFNSLNNAVFFEGWAGQECSGYLFVPCGIPARPPLAHTNPTRRTFARCSAIPWADNHSAKGGLDSVTELVLGGRSRGFSPFHYPQIQLFAPSAFGNRPVRPESQPRASRTNRCSARRRTPRSETCARPPRPAPGLKGRFQRSQVRKHLVATPLNTPSGLETNLGGAPDPGLRPGLSEIGPSGLNRKRGQSKTKQSLRGTAWFHG